MNTTVRQDSRLVQVVSLLVVGFGIGWLVGLSASPVVGGVVAGLVGVGAGLITGLQTIGRGSPSSQPGTIDAMPAAVVILGIAIAAPVGIVARTHRVFEPNRPAVDQGASSKPYQGVLFGKRVKTCEKLTALADAGEKEAFLGEFRNTSAKAKVLVDSVQNYQTLKLVAEVLCEAE